MSQTRSDDLKPKEAIDHEALQKEIEALKKSNAELEERLLRSVADQKNLLERTRKEVRDAGTYSMREFMSGLLPVIDVLEESVRSILQDERTPASLAEGLQMTLEMLTKTLGEHQIEVIDPLNETFDPNRHDAISMEATDEAPAKTIIRVIQKGYQIKDRLLRPALVIVAKEKNTPAS